MNFSMNAKTQNDVLLITMKGRVDESAVFSDPDLSKSKNVILDLEGLISITSGGVRRWIEWTKKLPPLNLSIRRCPAVVINQINMINGLVPATTKFESFYVPYYAETNGDEKMILFQNGKEFKDGKIFPPMNVKNDLGEPMEMDVTQDVYFRFLKKFSQN